MAGFLGEEEGKGEKGQGGKGALFICLNPTFKRLNVLTF